MTRYLEIQNDSNSVIISDSDQGVFTVGNLFTPGIYTPGTNPPPLPVGWTMYAYPTIADDETLWVRPALNTETIALPMGHHTSAETGNIAGTSCIAVYPNNPPQLMRTKIGKTAGLVSGYFDVYDETGALIWSANSAARAPKIYDFFSIGAGAPNTASRATAGQRPFVMVSQLHGEWFNAVNPPLYCLCGINIIQDSANLTVRFAYNYNDAYFNINDSGAAQMFKNGATIPLASFYGV